MTTLLALILIVIMAFLVYVALKPSAFRIERTQPIRASGPSIFPFINDLREFNRWNPFAQGDPVLKIDYLGPSSGPGAAYTWVGSNKSGAGRMEITDSNPTSRVAVKLDFSKPFEAHNQVEFTLRPEGAETLVTWTMTGVNPYFHKLMGTLFNMDKMVGGQFERGLASRRTWRSASDKAALPPGNGTIKGHAIHLASRCRAAILRGLQSG